MNNLYGPILRQALALAGVSLICATSLHGQVDAGDLLVVDAGNNRVLQVDVSAGSVTEVFSQSDFEAINGSGSAGLSGQVFYDDFQSYLYVSGNAGSNRLYQADVGTGVVSLTTETGLLGLQGVPEAHVELTGKAVPESDVILLAGPGCRRGIHLWRQHRNRLGRSLRHGTGLPDLFGRKWLRHDGSGFRVPGLG